MKLKHHFIIGLLFWHIGAIAQVSVSSSSRNIFIGEQFTLTFSFSKKVGEIDPAIFRFDSIPHFEVIKKSLLDSTRTGERLIYSQNILLTSFDTGRWIIPPQVFQAGKRKYMSDTISVSVLPAALKSNAYYDIHEILTVPEPASVFRKALLITGVLLSIGLLIFFISRRKKKRSETSSVKKDPYVAALSALDKLNKQNNDVAFFYTALYSIYRTYLTGLLGVELAGKTTGELILQMKSELDEHDFFLVANVLRMADAVKFAKYSSSPEEVQSSLQTIRTAIDLIHEKRAS